jgi:hypothetical protein
MLDPNAAVFQLSPKTAAPPPPPPAAGAGGRPLLRSSTNLLRGLQDLDLPDGFVGGDGDGL